MVVLFYMILISQKYDQKGGVEARGRLLAPQMNAAALGASSTSPTGHSCGLGTAASIVGAPGWRISPPSEIQRFLI